MVTVAIKVNGVDITDHVKFDRATFTSQVNGAIGECQFPVKDLDHTFAFTLGKLITLEIDGELHWSGFVSKISRQYAFSVDKTTVPAATSRYFLITGVDVNVLLHRRVVWNKGDPTNDSLTPPPAYTVSDPAKGGEWEAGTPSNVVVEHVVTEYSDLLADGVTLDLMNMGSPMPEPDLPGHFTPSETVAKFLSQVNVLLGGIWYLTPDRVLVHRDVETTTTGYYLTDAPGSDPDAIGPRDYIFTSDASDMVNDAFVWGAAMGSRDLVFSRVTSDPDIAIHSRWQYSELNTHMYQQSTVDTRATALVYGNTLSLKGARHDRLVCEATVFEPVFHLGDVVLCEAKSFLPEGEPFDEEAAHLSVQLPVRKITTTFPTPTDARFQLTLTQELDTPWNMYESLWGDRAEPITEEPCTDPIIGTCAGITDTFDGRTFETPLHESSSNATYVGAIGPSDHGAEWDVQLQGRAQVWVENDDCNILLSHTSAAGPGAASLRLPANAVLQHVAHSFRFLLRQLPGEAPGDSPDRIVVRFSLNDVELSININPTGLFYTGSFIGLSPGGGNSEIPNSYWATNVWYTVTLLTGPSSCIASISGSPGAYAHSAGLVETTVDQPYIQFDRDVNIVTDTHNSIIVELEDVDIPELCATDAEIAPGADPDGGSSLICVNQQETFTRSVASGWGTSELDGNPAWTRHSSGFGTSVSGGRGLISGRDTSPASLSVQPSFNTDPIEILVKCVLTSSGSFANAWMQLGIGGVWPTPLTHISSIGFALGPSGGSFTVRINDPPPGGTLTASAGSSIDPLITPGIEFWFKWRIESHTVRGRMWRFGDSEPSTWVSANYNLAGDPHDHPTHFQVIVSDGSDVSTWSIDSIEFTGGLDQICTGGGDPTGPSYEPRDDCAPINSSETSRVATTDGPSPYRPAYVPQLDGSEMAGFNCGCAATAMAVDRHTLGATTTTGAVIRAATGDTDGGTTLSQNDAAANTLGVDLDRQSGIATASALTRLDSGQGMVLQGSSIATNGTRWSASEDFIGNHAWYVNERRWNGSQYEWLVYDPLADGRRVGIAKSPMWVPEDRCLYFAAMLQFSDGSRLGYGSLYAMFTDTTVGGGGSTGGPNPTTGTTTLFKVSPYVVKTTEVWVDGVKQLRGTDYTESDPFRGQITFATAISVTAVVEVFYLKRVT